MDDAIALPTEMAFVLVLAMMIESALLYVLLANAYNIPRQIAIVTAPVTMVKQQKELRSCVRNDV
jgi:hypothetical protein